MFLLCKIYGTSHKAAVDPSKHLLISMESKLQDHYVGKQKDDQETDERAKRAEGGGESGLGCVSSCIIINDDIKSTSFTSSFTLHTHFLSDAHRNDICNVSKAASSSQPPIFDRTCQICLPRHVHHFYLIATKVARLKRIIRVESHRSLSIPLLSICYH